MISKSNPLTTPVDGRVYGSGPSPRKPRQAAARVGKQIGDPLCGRGLAWCLQAKKAIRVSAALCTGHAKPEASS